MSRFLLAATASLLLASPVTAHEYVYGPAPDWNRYRQLAETELRARMPEPDRWSIERPNGYIRDRWRHHGLYPGYTTCGIARASGQVRGYNPVTQFVAVIDHDRVQAIDISGRESNSLPNLYCAEMIAHGRLPPAKTMEQPHDLPVASLGLTIRPMPEGAYVVAVVTGSSGAKAGLTSGTVLTLANGIALAAMGPAMAAGLDSDANMLALDTAAGGHVEVRR